MQYETKDSGKRRSFDSGMVRDTTTGKTLWHLVAAGPMMKRWAELLTRGAEKYDANNWLKASGTEEQARAVESAFRHFMQWFNGETDEDHAAAVFFNINLYEYVTERMQHDVTEQPGEQLGEIASSLDPVTPTSEDVEEILARRFGRRDCKLCDMGALHRVADHDALDEFDAETHRLDREARLDYLADRALDTQRPGDC
jgi:hypothetical protein